MAIKTVRDYALKAYKELEEDKASLKRSMEITNSEIKSIDDKINALDKEIGKLRVQREMLMVDRDNYDELIKADIITRMALRESIHNRYPDEVI